MYAAPLGQETGFQQIGQARIDNLANGRAAPRYELALTPGLGFVFRLTGEASLFLPGIHSMTVGLSLADAAGGLVHDFGNQYVDATHALLYGLFYAAMR